MILLIFLILFVLPCSADADCILTDTPYKFEVVCSGNDPTHPPADSKKKSKTVKKSSRKPGKINFEERTGTTSHIDMSDEEMHMMQTNNALDGYRIRRKTKEQHAGL
ncbi:MAG: hypothetical protein PHI31_16715 [Desulfuromonadaceae bacterium]|nr:hypothetical protein [Desulfuromonadaceae bacterium]